MANRATIPISQLQPGEQGYCAMEVIYVAPSAPAGPEEGRSVGETERFVLPDAEIHAEQTPLAKARLRRLEAGLALHLPSGELPTRYRPRVLPGSLPVVALE